MRKPSVGYSGTTSCDRLRTPGEGSAWRKTLACGTCPCMGYAQNQVWYEIVALACDLLAWMAMLALTGPARRWEPKRIRLRLFSCAWRLARGGRRLKLHLARTWPWAPDLITAISRLHALQPG